MANLSFSQVIKNAKIASKKRGYDMYIIFNPNNGEYAFSQSKNIFIDEKEVITHKVDGNTVTSLPANPKKYYETFNVGKCKYLLSFHTGNSFHKDGSPFFDVKTFSNKRLFNSAIKKLIKEGYDYKHL